MQAIILHHKRQRRYSLSRSSNLLDMSAFVDLAIILLCSIAFLQLLHRERAFEIITPESINPNQFMCTEGRLIYDDSISLLSFVLTDTRVLYYEGMLNYDGILYYRGMSDYSTLSFPISEPYHIPNIVTPILKEIKATSGNSRQLIVVLYPTSQTSFKNLMDVIDELNQVSNLRYSIDFSNIGDHILSNVALFYR
jgi:hypothetical protein